MTLKPVLIIVSAIILSACGDDKNNMPVNALAQSAQTYITVKEDKPPFVSPGATVVEPCSLDAINQLPAQENNPIGNKSQVMLAGWAANVPKGITSNEIWIEFSGQKDFYLKAAIKEQRPDVASYFNKPNMLNSGWRVFADLGNMSSGAYKVRIFMVDSSGSLVCDTKRQIKVE